MNQLELFPAPAPVLPPAADWWTGAVPDLSGSACYIIMIRAPGDPECPPKPKNHAERDKAPHLTLRKQEMADWKRAIAQLLGDGAARTFNSVCVTLCGLTADICGGEVPEEALWSLVEGGTVEHTAEAPILFRLVKRVAEEPCR